MSKEESMNNTQLARLARHLISGILILGFISVSDIHAQTNSDEKGTSEDCPRSISPGEAERAKQADEGAEGADRPKCKVSAKDNAKDNAKDIRLSEDEDTDDDIFDGETIEELDVNTHTNPSQPVKGHPESTHKDKTQVTKSGVESDVEIPSKMHTDEERQLSNASQNANEKQNSTDREKIRTLDVITIIGNQEKLERASGSAFRISGKALDAQEHDDVHRVLKQVPGVYVRDEDGFGLRPNIGLRGASSDRSAKVSLMEDGVLMAPAPYAAPAAYYFPLTTRLKGMEVFKGPSAIKYGPNTIGGALNFTTRPSVARGNKGTIDIAMGSYGAQKAHVFFGQGFSNFGYVLEGARVSSDGFKELDNGGDTGFQKDDWMLKAHVKTDASASIFQRLELKMGLARESSNETYLGLTDSDFEQTPYRRYAASQLGDMSWKRTQFKLHYMALIGEDLEWSITGYRHDFQRAWRKLNGFKLSDIDIHDAVLDPTNPKYRPFIELLKGTSEWTPEASEMLRIGTNDRTYVSQGIQSKLELTNRFGLFRNTLELGILSLIHI